MTVAVALQAEKGVIEKMKPDIKQRRVVVTGMGVVTPLGHDPDMFYNNLLDGVSGISEIERFDCSKFPTVIQNIWFSICSEWLPCQFYVLVEYFHTAFDTWTLIQRIAGEIKSFSTDGWVAPKLAKRMDKFMLYLITAGKKALENGGLTEDVMNELDKTRCGVLVGSAMGGMKVCVLII
jgi:3-oxoacyl-[acyl-carrier-protein] synthase II